MTSTKCNDHDAANKEKYVCCGNKLIRRYLWSSCVIIKKIGIVK